MAAPSAPSPLPLRPGVCIAVNSVEPVARSCSAQMPLRAISDRMPCRQQGGAGRRAQFACVPAQHSQHSTAWLSAASSGLFSGMRKSSHQPKAGQTAVPGLATPLRLRPRYIPARQLSSATQLEQHSIHCPKQSL